MYYIVIGAFLCGVGLQTLFAMSVPAMVWVALLGFVVALVARRNSGAISARYLTAVSLTLILFVSGMVRTEVHTWQFGNSSLEADLGKEVTLEGIVVQEPNLRERSQQLFVEVEEDLVLVSADRLNQVSYGDTLIFTGTLEKPESFTTDLGRTFEYQNYLLAKGVEYHVSFAEITVESSNNGNRLITYLLYVKHQFMDAIESVLPEPQAGLGEGLLLGVKQALGDSLEADFRATGIIHIVVLSGYNIMLVVAFVLFILGFFLRPKQRAIVGIAAIVCFALIVGLSATVVRASIMASLLLIAGVLGRSYHVLRALFLAGAVMVFINPYILLYDIGFQLSFMATLGLILVAPRFETMLASVPNRIGIREFLIATIATQIAVLPLLLYHIGEISLVAVMVNVLVLPVVPFAMLFTFIAGVISLFSVTVGTGVGLLAYLSLSYIIVIAETFAALPFAAITVPQFSAWWVSIMYTAPLAGYLWYKRRASATNEFSDWEVVEEVTLFKSASPTGDAQQDTPAFFR